MINDGVFIIEVNFTNKCNSLKITVNHLMPCPQQQFDPLLHKATCSMHKMQNFVDCCKSCYPVECKIGHLSLYFDPGNT